MLTGGFYTIIEYFYNRFHVLLLPGNTIYSLKVESVKVHSLNALQYHNRNYRVVTNQEILQWDTENRSLARIIHAILRERVVHVRCRLLAGQDRRLLHNRPKPLGLVGQASTLVRLAAREALILTSLESLLCRST